MAIKPALHMDLGLNNKKGKSPIHMQMRLIYGGGEDNRD